MEQFVKCWINILRAQSLVFFELVDWPSAVLLVLPAWLSPHLTCCWKNTIHTKWIFLEQTRCDFWDCQFQSQSLESKLKLANKVISGGLRSAHDKAICQRSFRPKALCLHALIQVFTSENNMKSKYNLRNFFVRINLAAQSTSVKQACTSNYPQHAALVKLCNH